MADNLTNNLFTYATSELSQDAFICYLMSFALEDAKDDPVLKECAKKILAKMMGLCSEDWVKIELTNIKRQIHNIDILLSASYNDQNYKIIIEDKTYSSEHDNQLERYKEIVKNKFEKEDIKETNIKEVYYKPTFQGNMENVKKAGYTIIGKDDIVKLLKPYCGKTNNRIILDYYEYWKNFHEDAKAYEGSLVKEWGRHQITAFYDYLQSMLIEKYEDFNGKRYTVSYGYVSNPSGGFYALWIYPKEKNITINNYRTKIYFQIEITPNMSENADSGNIHLKLRVEDEEKEANNSLKSSLIELAKNIGFDKPKVVRAGKTMAFGEVVGNYAEMEHNDFENVIMKAIKEFTSLCNKQSKSE